MRILAAMLLIGLASEARAEPSSEIKFLMDRPVSMLDWGMFKLQQHLKPFSMGITVSYKWKDNEIGIADFERGASVSSMEEAEALCKTTFARWDSSLLVKAGKDIIPDYCAACENFSHDGWSGEGLSEAKSKLKDRFVYLLGLDGYICERKLYEPTISIKKY